MKKISQEEFEAKVQDIIDGKTTRVKLLLELRTDRNTLNNKIQELVVYNPELYRAFITKFPYVPREYTHIDYEALVIDILKKGYTRREWDDVYQIHSRTISRKIYEVEKENPELIALYREISGYKKRQEDLPDRLKKQIDELEEKEIYLGGVCDKKREELVSQEKTFVEKLQQGTGVAKASKEMGMGRFSKRIDTLNRIDIEKQFREKNEDEGER